MSGGPIASTSTGDLEGSWAGAVARFDGIPYAEAPTGDRRWAPPVPRAPWSGVRQATAPGPVAPQLGGPLAPVTGPVDLSLAREDCLTIDLRTPEPSAGAGLPVVVFVHGGGYVSGAGSLPWYDGTSLAALGCVTVNLNYRLGVLGFGFLPEEVTGGEPVANLGLQDLCLGLEWVAENVAAFGGDPGRVTVVGQSVGAHAIACLAAIPAARSRFHRVVLQSGPFGSPAMAPERAEQVTARFLAKLGLERPTLAELRELPVQDLLAAQAGALIESLVFGRLGPPFGPVVDGTLLATDPVAELAANLAGHDLLLGYTGAEARAFFYAAALWGIDVWERTAAELADHARAAGNSALAELLPAYAELDSSQPAGAAFCDLVGDEFMVRPTIELAHQRADAGPAPHLYELTWAPEEADPRLGSCHAIDLPLLFGSFDAWAGSPLLGGGPGAGGRELSARIQGAWHCFAERGDPGHPELPPWPRAEGEHPVAMRLDLECATTASLAGGRERLWGAGR
ncbi:MAG TPA: carboxylesterase family protein [Solirubrobacterales bacterium]|jgi:para-nitrobenzyl esterase